MCWNATWYMKCFVVEHCYEMFFKKSICTCYAGMHEWVQRMVHVNSIDAKIHSVLWEWDEVGVKKMEIVTDKLSLIKMQFLSLS